MGKSTVTFGMLVDYLIKYSSEAHKVCADEIVSYFCAKMEYLNPEEPENADLNTEDFDEEEFSFYYSNISVCEKIENTYQSTTKQQVMRLLRKWCNKPIFAGFCIRASKGKGKIKSFHKVYYIQTPLNEISINMLRDALEIFPYSEIGTTGEIIHQLNRLTPAYNRREFDTSLISINRYSGTTFYQNLHTITEAFCTMKSDSDEISKLTLNEKKINREQYEKLKAKRINKISFLYCEYDENKELIVKKNRFNSTSDRRIVNPVKIMWTNGYYYLVTAIPEKNCTDKDKKYKYINYRIDRMTEVKLEDEYAEMPYLFKPEEYRNQHPVMYSKKASEGIRIQMICNKALINNIIDTFGFDVEISEIQNDNNKVLVTLKNTSHAGVKMWALEYGDNCEIIHPPKLREEMKKAAEHLLEVYSSEN